MEAVVSQTKLNVQKAIMAANHAQRMAYTATQSAAFVRDRVLDLKQAWEVASKHGVATLSAGGGGAAGVDLQAARDRATAADPRYGFMSPTGNEIQFLAVYQIMLLVWHHAPCPTLPIHPNT